MSEPYDPHRPVAPQQGHPHGARGTSRLPMQALGAPPPDLQPSAPDYPRYDPAPQPGPPGRSKAMEYTLKGLGLLAVAVLSGSLWYLLRNNPAPPVTPPSGEQQSGLFTFQPYRGPSQDSNCAAHAYGQVQDYLRQHGCTQLTRSLYTTTLADGEKVITSVATIKMGTAENATGLETLARANNTGNVKDLIEDGDKVPTGPPNLRNGAFGSTTKGRSVVITLSEFLDRTMDNKDVNNNGTLQDVSKDALRLGESS